MTTTQTLKQFIAKNRITIRNEWVDENPNMDDFRGNHWKYQLRCRGKTLSGYFSMGYGLSGEPGPDDVLNCLALDAMGVENARDFRDWCGEYGYDDDSVKALKTYKLCVRFLGKLKAFLGDEAYAELLQCESL